MQKQGTGPKVTPTGDFISTILPQITRRLIRNQERLSFIMEDIQKNFKLGAKECSTILSELQELGFDVMPTDWLLCTAAEHRAELLSKFFIRSGKTYGSRSEDIEACIKHCNEELASTNSWLKENESASRLSPQTFYQYVDMKKNLEDKIDSLNQFKKVTASSEVLYSTADITGTPLTLLGFNVSDKVYGILRTGAGDIVKEDAEKLTSTPEKHEIMKPDTIEDDMLFNEFKTLCMSGDPLQSLFEMFDEEEHSQPKSKEMMESYLNDFSEWISENQGAYTFEKEQIQDALNQIDTFAKENGIETQAKRFMDDTIKAPEKTEVTEKAASANKMDVKVADTITFFDHITDLINTLRTASDIPKTAEADKALSELSTSLGEIKFYVKEQLVDESPLQKEAAYVILSNIANNLSDIEKNYRNLGQQEYMPYIVSSLIKSLVKKGKNLINTLGE